MPNKLGNAATAGVVLALGLSACGGSSGGGAAPTTAQQPRSSGSSGKCSSPTNVTFRLNWLLDYEQVPYYVAKDQGYYAAHCLNVTIQPGRGSADTATIVGSGTAQLGVADTVAVIQGQAKGLPLTGTAVVWRNNAFAIVARNAALHGNANPKPTDLYGMTFGAVTTGSPYIFWKAFVHEQHLDPSKIKEESIAAPGYAQMAQGSVDFLANFTSASIDLTCKGVPNTTLKAANFGQQGYGLSITANNGWLQGHGQAMKDFLAATAQGMAWSANHPSQALAIEGKANPALTSSAAVTNCNLEGFKADAALWATNASLGHGAYLNFDDSGVRQTEKILYDGGVLTGSEYNVTPNWTSQYIPVPSVYQPYQQGA